MTAAGALDRRTAVPRLIGDPRDFLIIAGLAGAARDVSALAGEAPEVFAFAGAMGGATPMGLGLALARPARRVLVVTGDGELLMNLGALATVAAADPPNLAILCVDNERYGETGYQTSHTGLGVDLAALARAAGIEATRTVSRESELASAADLLRRADRACFVLVEVGTGPPPPVKRSFDAARARIRFRAAVGAGQHPRDGTGDGKAKAAGSLT